jgi:hypothetical protein
MTAFTLAVPPRGNLPRGSVECKNLEDIELTTENDLKYLLEEMLYFIVILCKGQCYMYYVLRLHNR